MANYETVVYESVEDKIRRLTLNRPEKLNAMSPKLLEELDDVMTVFEDDPDASVLIVRGAGRAFLRRLRFECRRRHRRVGASSP